MLAGANNANKLTLKIDTKT